MKWCTGCGAECKVKLSHYGVETPHFDCRTLLFSVMAAFRLCSCNSSTAASTALTRLLSSKIKLHALKCKLSGRG